MKLGKGSFPATEAAAAQILSLPMFPTLTREQQVRVADEILRYLRRGSDANEAGELAAVGSKR
jgi:dTDP-4-amino-4,6-dideoxygalactose transaminase